MSQDSESSAFRSRIAKEPSTSSSHCKPAEVLLWAQRRGGASGDWLLSREGAACSHCDAHVGLTREGTKFREGAKYGTETRAKVLS